MININFQSKLIYTFYIVITFTKNYYFLRQDASELDSFLKPMLQIDPGSRCTATAALSHEWLSGVDTNVPIPMDTPPDSESESDNNLGKSDG